MGAWNTGSFSYSKTARGRVIVSLLAILIGTLFCWIAYPDLRDARSLRRSRAGIDAQVTAWRVSSTHHGFDSFDLRYRFKPPGHDRYFTRRERGTRNDNVWSSLEEKEWQEARESGQIRVVYVPDKPGINCPASLQFSSYGSVVFGMICGSALLIGGSFYLTSALLKRSSSPQPAGNGVGTQSL